MVEVLRYIPPSETPFAHLVTSSTTTSRPSPSSSTADREEDPEQLFRTSEVEKRVSWTQVEKAVLVVEEETGGRRDPAALATKGSKHQEDHHHHHHHYPRSVEPTSCSGFPGPAGNETSTTRPIACRYHYDAEGNMLRPLP